MCNFVENFPRLKSYGKNFYENIHLTFIGAKIGVNKNTDLVFSKINFSKYSMILLHFNIEIFIYAISSLFQRQDQFDTKFFFKIPRKGSFFILTYLFSDSSSTLSDF